MSLSGLTVTLGNPTFTSWSTLSSSEDIMEFTGTEFNTSYAALYLETTNWDTWTDATTNNSAD